MKELCMNEAFEKYGQYEDWYRSATHCKGRSCPNYGKCKGNEEFNKLTKRTPTDYEIETAIENERRNGIWDRETNNY